MNSESYLVGNNKIQDMVFARYEIRSLGDTNNEIRDTVFRRGLKECM